MAEPGHGHGITRRGFVAWVMGILGSIIAALIGIPGVGYLLSPALKSSSSSGDDWVPLGTIDDLIPDEPRLFTFTRTKQSGWERTANSYGVYVVRKPDGSLDVFSNICTHLSCRVNWVEEDGQFICPCHDGRFALDGDIVSGPQPRPLDRFEHKIEEGTLLVHLVEE